MTVISADDEGDDNNDGGDGANGNNARTSGFMPVGGLVSSPEDLYAKISLSLSLSLALSLSLSLDEDVVIEKVCSRNPSPLKRTFTLMDPPLSQYKK